MSLNVIFFLVGFIGAVAFASSGMLTKKGRENLRQDPWPRLDLFIDTLGAAAVLWLSVNLTEVDFKQIGYEQWNTFFIFFGYSLVYPLELCKHYYFQSRRPRWHAH